MITSLLLIIGIWITRVHAGGKCGSSPDVIECESSSGCFPNTMMDVAGSSEFICQPFCSSYVACNNRATVVTFKSDNCNQGEPFQCSHSDSHDCECTECNEGWGGTTCDVCAVGYQLNAAGDCELICTVSSSCSSRATTVTFIPATGGCDCDCIASYSSTDCSVCELKYDQTACDQCATNYITYPTCTQCSNSDHCNSHASFVSADSIKSKCICNCNTAFQGTTCDECSIGYITYPSCTECNSFDHCTNRAASVTSNAAKSDCVCTCKNSYSGDKCQVCDPKYGGSDCDECAVGFINYPTCTKCTVGNHCSNHANTVTDMSRITCVCDCRNEWSGDTCDTCATKYTGDCDVCAANHINFPSCDKCTVGVHCSNHASSVVDDGMRNSCICTCESSYSTSDCSQCANGHINYPTCTKCTTSSHCSGHANTVASDSLKQNCDCDCRNKWSGTTCDSCNVEYSGDCDVCAVGYIGPFPSCTQCTVATHCSNHASSVTDDGTRTTCACSCEAGFTASDCSQCSVGHVNYPTCTECTVAAHCSGNANSVTDDGMRNTCVCTCKTAFTGSSCDSCADNYIGYPTCTKCTVKDHCSDHAGSVVSDALKQNCECDCRNKWTGITCDSCDAKYSGDCDVCAVGHIDFPNCIECEVGAHCSNHASSVTDDGTRTTCACSCEAGFTGSGCSQCSVGHVSYPTCTECTVAAHCSGNANSVTDDGMRNTCVCTCKTAFTGSSCDSCADNYIGYPTCTKCTVKDHCSDHADSVVSDALKQNCECDCRNKWTGTTCDSCDAKYSGDCDVCAVGHIDFPNCIECEVGAHCSNHASSVTDDGTRTTCACSCEAGFTGSDCSQCSVGHVSYPTCTECTVAAHCSGNANSVTDDGMRNTCVCTCKTAFTGSSCDSCADNYIGYPTCTKCTVKDHCSDHAGSVVSDALKQNCECDCRNKWTGITCDSCDAKYSGDCDVCAVGHIDFPNCIECEVGAHCSNHASSVTDDGTRTTCACSCEAGFTESDCSQCSVGHVSYPTCTECTVAAHCSGNANSVTDDGMRNTCVCTCKTAFTGSSCDSCADNYIGYPTCTKCTVKDHCSDHAGSVVSDALKQNCECDCRNKWTGTTCDSCDAKYSRDCDVCAVGHIDFPNCVECEVGAHCSNHASSVTDDGTRTTCACSCEAGFTGSDCSQCSVGHVSYPTCTECTVAAHCSGHANSVTDDGMRNTCVCTCKTAFTGSSCDSCADNYIGYPTCTKCTVKDHCSDHADSVKSDASKQNCECDCRNKWTGTTCDSCDAKYSGDCDVCAVGHIDFPNCVECEVGAHCSNHASSVTDDGTRTTCACSCEAGFTGSDCSQCSVGHVSYPTCTECTVAAHCSGHANSVTDDGMRNTCVCTCKTAFTGSSCDSCADNYIGYPTCTKCTVKDHCSDHADSVVSDALKQNCECDCRNKWTGTTCDSCDAQYSGDCDVCAVGHIDFPNCIECEVGAHCSNHASSVTDDGTRTTCACSCEAGFTGSDCSQCSVGHVNYPTCTECTVAAHCSGNANSVTDDGMRNTCVCTCKTAFTGSSCDSCADNYIGYPTCTKCTVKDHCSDHADSVVSDALKQNCECDCRNKWTGTTCDSCDAKYSGDCDVCAVGHIDFPNCVECEVGAHCSNHASSVTDDGTRTTCACSCEAGFTGSDCSQCSVGHVNYPTCTECTVAAHCSGNANSVTDDGMRNTCVCTCKTAFTGSSCDSCADNYIGYPTCTKCTVKDHCSDHADSVVSDALKQNCECDCRNKWTGTTCDSCDAKYSGDCDVCAVGHIDFPNCVECEVGAHCSNHASSVTDDGTRTTCACSCEAGFTGSDCSQCSVGHVNYPTCTECTVAAHCSGHANSVTDDGMRNTCVCSCGNSFNGTTCDKCADGYIGYPTCGGCTVKDHCSDHADSVKSDASKQNCECDCRNKWTGTTCDSCDAKYSGDCDVCAVGHIDFPNCIECEVGAHCSNHASSVTDDGTRATCACSCEAGFTGSDCSQCSVGHVSYPTCTECTVAAHCSGNANSVTDDGMRNTCVCTCKTAFTGSSCDSCADNYIGYPTCTKCTVKDHCSDHAGSVVSDALKQNCECDCRNKWTGTTCDSCDAKYSGDCDVCAVGHIDFPNCIECEVGAHCSNHASSVTDDGTRTTCACSCEAGFTESDCSQCSVGHVNYPTCTECTVAAHCSGHANSVTDDGMRNTCVCSCGNSFNGTTCDKCADGYIGYPTCGGCTVKDHCSDHADSVVSDALKQNCECDCRNKWTGTTCDSCDAKYSGDCDVCAVGHIDFPNCIECEVGAHCSNHASSVTDDGTRTSCVCSCDNKWTSTDCSVCPSEFGGPNCDVCAVGKFDFPNCLPCTPIDACNGNSNSATVVNDKCICDCSNQWSGDTCNLCVGLFEGSNCDKCITGHINYPSCTLCNNSIHCNGNADSVIEDGSRTSCNCNCKTGFEGIACDSCSSDHINYPTCRKCDTTTDCSGNAVSVTDNNKQSCLCTCSNQWTGPACDNCDVKYELNCGSCAAGYIKPFPQCEKCTTATHCNNNADSVTDNGDRSFCKCDCRNMWTGNDCLTCPSTYGGPDCDECATGAVGFPSCGRCSNLTDCNSHATYVGVNKTTDSCTCTCSNQYDGDSCDSCSADHINYPTCTLCDNSLHCNGHAATVGVDTVLDVCTCTCESQYEGSDCDKCSANHINYPSCTLCDNLIHCSGHAISVADDGMRSECVCVCDNKWAGKTCDVCPSEYGGLNCDECASGRINFDNCTECTNTTHCNGHAISVDANKTTDTCTCTCSNQYDGDSCDSCSADHINYPTCTLCDNSLHCNGHAATVGVDTVLDVCTCTCESKYEGSDCDKCSANHINYPSCTLCDNLIHCSGHAISVADDGMRSECACVCDNKWTGKTCDVCPSEYGGLNCDECASGRINFDTCTECTLLNHCSGHATNVTNDITQTSCQCDCENSWSGSQCEVCDLRYDNTNLECDTCSVGHINYPTCMMCDINTCSGHASSISDNGNRTECVCNCLNNWTGPQCSDCKPQYEGPNCDVCSTNRINFPTCEMCNVTVHCQNAISVQPNPSQTKCECLCEDSWVSPLSGTQCSVCPPQFEQQNCDNCTTGYYGYPTCTKCDVQTGCSNHAIKATVVNDICNCDCSNQWTGLTCDTCDDKYDQTTCDRCAVGYITFPNCIKCDDDVHCSSHGVAKSNANNTKCVCDCENSWTHSLTGSCDVCDSVKFSGALCDNCAVGLKDYPLCGDICTISSCGGINKAISVIFNSATSNCDCSCSNQYLGAACDICDSKFAGNCDGCATGFIEFPLCDECTVDLHCSGNAISVTSNILNDGCLCSCKNSFLGPLCDGCPPGMDLLTCSTCADGWMGLAPQCTQCDNFNHCNNNAETITATLTRCICNCKNQFTGDNCLTCPTNYMGVACDSCSPGFINYPTCTPACTLDNNCTAGNAISVEWLPPTGICICNCTTNWEGLECDTCPIRYGGVNCDICSDNRINYPTCTLCSTSQHCSNNADSVGILNNYTCDCNCTGQWSNPQCDYCPLKYSGVDCDVCADGYINYPTCYKCSVVSDCNARATIVSTDVLKENCTCDCINSWTGSSCEICPELYTGANCDECHKGFDRYPSCGRECTVIGNCSNNAISVSHHTINSTCNCECSNKWSSDDCSVCPFPYEGIFCDQCQEGYINYPSCIKCSINDHCNGRGTNITDNGLRQFCVCDCTDQWIGDSCDYCNKRVYDDSCSKCLPFLFDYPTCRDCYIDDDCNGRASEVTVSEGFCICSCLAGWEGEHCEYCPPVYEQLKCRYGSVLMSKSLFRVKYLSITNNHHTGHVPPELLVSFLVATSQRRKQSH